MQPVDSCHTLLTVSLFWFRSLQFFCFPFIDITGNARIEQYHSSGVLCWSGNDDEAHAGRHQHNAQVSLLPAEAQSGLLAVASKIHMSMSTCAWQGVISVASNLVPGLFSKLMHQASSLQSSLSTYP